MWTYIACYGSCAGRKELCETDCFVYVQHWEHIKKPKQTLQNNCFSLLVDRKTLHHLTEGCKFVQKDSWGICPLSHMHRRSNYSSIGQTAISSRQSSILGWQKIRSKRTINHVPCFLFSTPISSCLVFLWPGWGLRIWQQCCTVAVASHRQSVSLATLWWA